MFSQPEIKKWGIFYPEREERVAKDFYNCLERTLVNCGFSFARPALFKLYGNSLSFETWQRELSDKIRPSV